MLWDYVAVLLPNNLPPGYFNLHIDLIQAFARGLLMDVSLSMKPRKFFCVNVFFREYDSWLPKYLKDIFPSVLEVPSTSPHALEKSIISSWLLEAGNQPCSCNFPNYLS